MLENGSADKQTRHWAGDAEILSGSETNVSEEQLTRNRTQSDGKTEFMLNSVKQPELCVNVGLQLKVAT